jgi:hypothetical protein
MGSERRSWMHEPTGRSVTCNLDALLLENESLRQQVRLLQEELARYQWQEPKQWQELNQEREPVARPAPATDAFRNQSSRGERVRSWRSGPEVTTGAAPGLTPQLARQWAEALSSHPRWRELRLGSRLEGDPAAGGRLELGLQDLLDHLRANSHDPALELEEALDRRSPGLGTELRWVLAGPASRVKAAVRAAFALHGPRAADRLSSNPHTLVDELLAAIAELEAAARRQHQARWDKENHRQQQAKREQQARSQQQADREREARRQRQAQQDQEAWRQQEARRQRESQRDARQSWGDSQQNSRQAAGRNPAAGPDRQRAEALILLELSHGASLAAVKAAHRRLVKCHHPDMGGDAEAFRRINAAYQLLIA